MIDIHCHILPGLDDGAQTIDESLQMAQEAVKQGIHTIIATPHFNYQFENEKDAILKRTALLNEQLLSHDIPLKVLPGQEIRIYGEMLEDYENGKILAAAQSNYCLIELPSRHVPLYTERLLFDLQLGGLIPIIVHPERNTEFIQHPDKLYQFVKNGALTQITASSLCGYFGKKIKRFTKQLIEANLTHFMASDAHNVTTRPFHIEKAFAELEKYYGMEQTVYYKENARLLIEGKTVYKEIAKPIRQKRFWAVFS